jgi:hypothetical protein
MSRELEIEVRLGLDSARQVDEFRSSEPGLATFGMRPYAIRLLPNNWGVSPGAEDLIRDLSTKLDEDLAIDDAVAILAPVVASAIERLGCKPTFLIAIDGLFASPSDQVLGLRLKYLLNALRGTKGYPRRIGGLTDLPPTFEDKPTILKGIYELCARASSDVHGLNSGNYDIRIDALCDELSVLDQMANAVELADDKMIFTWPAGQVQEPYLPSGGWQTLRTKVDATRGVSIQLDPYQTPCYFWIRKAVWRTAEAEKPVAISQGRNGALEDMFGVKRLTVFGPGPAMIKSEGPAEIELEFSIHASDVVIKDILLMLKSRIDAKAKGRRL